MSGVRADRPRLARAIAALDQGNVLTVTRIDRLACRAFAFVGPHLVVIEICTHRQQRSFRRLKQ